MLFLLTALADQIIGIDLGTTYSCVGITRNGQTEIIPNELGNRITPSFVSFTPDGQRLVGDAAKNMASEHPESTIYDIKRLIGRRYTDESVQKDIKHFPYKVVNVNDKPHVRITQKDVKTGKDVTKDYSPEEISAMILQKMKAVAEEYLGEPVTRAVVTVPAYFSDAQRTATRDAGRIAGLEIVRIINEPTAASIAYGLDKKGERTILTYDLGGGTFDVSVLRIQDGVFEVLATNGDTHLGGEDFDARVVDYLLKQIKSKHGLDLKNAKTPEHKSAYSRLKREVESAKRILSTSQTTKIEVDLVPGVSFSETLTRAKFEELNMDLFKKTMQPVENVLKDSKLKISDINEIILVGGSTRIPRVQELLKAHFSRKELSNSVHPDEAVGAGASVQAAALSGGEQGDSDILLLDVTPLTLGIETVGGIMTPLIERNTYVPVKRSKTFSTVQDGQTQVNITVYEGERAKVADNNLLGHFLLDGIPSLPRGQPQIEVTFSIDQDGVLVVSAVEKGSGQEKQIKIENDRGRLSEEEIQRLVQEAQDAEEEDRKFREVAEVKNNLNAMIYDISSRLDAEKEGNIASEVTPDDRDALTEAADAAKDWMADADDASVNQWREQLKKLQEVVAPILQKYGSGQSGNKGSGHDEDDDDDFKDEL